MKPRSSVKWDWLVLMLLLFVGLSAFWLYQEQRKFQEAPVIQVDPPVAHDFEIFSKGLEKKYHVRFEPTMPGTLLWSILGERPQVDRAKEEIRAWALDCLRVRRAATPPRDGLIELDPLPCVIFHQE
ncbi:MAG: hypothetical protein JWO82_2739 [Akkermansiaceae bacterium]|nr:hypothetical protein [Akkermansiaceae bacterium]